MLDIQRLILLREVVRRGTMRAAADALAFSPSAVSQQLGKLEREVGSPLFEKEGRRLRPTASALLLVEHADRILDEMEVAESALEASLGEVAGVVSIGAFASGASELAAPAAVSLQRRHPRLQVHVHEMEDPVSVRELRLGGLDVALLQEYTGVPADVPAFLRVERLLEEPVVLALPDRWAVPSTLADLRDAPWIAEPLVNPAGRALLHACRGVGFEPDIHYRVVSFPVITALVRQGLGVSLVPRMAVRGDRSGVRFVPVPEQPLSRKVAIGVRPASRSRPAVHAVVDALTDIASALGAA